jgi:uncharacterized protein YycO
LQFQRGDILLKHGFGPLSLAIETVSHSLFSHVAIIVDPEKELLIEADGFRDVGFKDMKDYIGECLIVRVADLSNFQCEQLIDFLHTQIGKPYDYVAILEEFERYFLGFVPTEHDERKYICSTLVSRAFHHIGITLTDVPLPSPNDIAQSKRITPIGFY